MFIVFLRNDIIGIFATKNDAVRHTEQVYRHESYDHDYGPSMRVEEWYVGNTKPSARWYHDECRQWWAPQVPQSDSDPDED